MSLPREAPGLRWLREDDRHYGIPRFVHSILDAAATVQRARPGAGVSVGDLSLSYGGVMLPHFSHRSGRDADLLFYPTTLEGEPLVSPGFVPFGPDGLAKDPAHDRYIRFDVAREWLLVKALLTDPDACVQWVFIHHTMRNMLLEWAEARGESREIIDRARTVMHEPHPGGAHDDHVHIRTSCSAAEVRTGCEQAGPVRPWVDMSDPVPLGPDDRRDLPVAKGATDPTRDGFLLSWSAGL